MNSKLKFHENGIIEKNLPSPNKVNEYIQKWDQLEDYVSQENALDKLFLELCRYNTCIEDILIKCSALNDFYSTNIFKVHNVAQHYLHMDIDNRLDEGDLTLVEDLAHIIINGKPLTFIPLQVSTAVIIVPLHIRYMIAMSTNC